MKCKKCRDREVEIKDMCKRCYMRERAKVDKRSGQPIYFRNVAPGEIAKRVNRKLKLKIIDLEVLVKDLEVKLELMEANRDYFLDLCRKNGINFGSRGYR